VATAETVRAGETVGTAVAVCHGLVKVYRSATGETHALRGIDLALRPGVLTVVAGPSGSGKSSLLHLLAARDRPSAGEVHVLAADLATARPRQLRELRRHRIGFVAQRSSGALFPHLTAIEQLVAVARLRGAGRGDAEQALVTVGLEHRADHRAATSSGGEQQRLAVALALVGTPALVVADEPTAELDHANADLVLAALARAAQAGSAVVVTSHDDRVVSRADRVLRLRHGVLSSETEGTGSTVAVIDSTGRLQLPPEALDLFPTGRAEVRLRDGEVVLRPPVDGEAQ
jgi:putative ABC transport system ATP-binding protein